MLVGLDCGKGNVYACTLAQIPRDLRGFATSKEYVPQVFRANHQDLAALLRLAQTYVIEPTGSYSRIFIEYLRKHGKTVLLVSDRRINAFRICHGLFNKNDAPDALAIAAYGLSNLGVPSAFISYSDSELRSAYNQYCSVSRASQWTQGNLGQRLCYEVPEWVKVYDGSRRKWLQAECPALWRFIATGECYNKARRETDLKATCGQGLSPESIEMARRLLAWHADEYQAELRLSQALKAPEYAPYHPIFDEFGMGPVTRAALLTVIHPFERFLNAEGKQDIDYVRASERSRRKSKITKRNRSLARFKLYCGLGRVEQKSGKQQGKEIKGGSARIRAAWYSHVSTAVILRGSNKEGAFAKNLLNPLLDAHYNPRNPNEPHPWNNPAIVSVIAERLKLNPVNASALVHYHCLKPGAGVACNAKDWHYQRMMSVSARLCNLLFRRLAEIKHD